MKKIHLLSIIIGILILGMVSCDNQTSSNKENQAAHLLSQPGNKASGAFISTTQQNIPVMSWVETDTSGKKHLFFAKMDTVKDQFSDPVVIPFEQNAMTSTEMNPKIAFKGDGTILVIYGISTPYKDLKWGLGDIHYIRSFDGGKHWTSPQSVSPEVKKGLSTNYTGLTRLGNGEIGMTWLGTNPKNREGARPIFFAKTNGKEGFGKEMLIDSSACECCDTDLSSGKNGMISIAFRDILPGMIRDISLSTSTDGGETFKKAVSFSHDHWHVNGCPHNGPSVQTKNGISYVAWFTGAKNKAGVYYEALDSTGKKIENKYLDPEGRFTQLCLLPDGTRVIAYNQNNAEEDKVHSSIVVVKANKGGFHRKVITPSDEDASYPEIGSAGNDKVVVAWENEDQLYYKVIDTKTIINPIPETIQLKDTKLTKDEDTPSLPVGQLASATDPVCKMDVDSSNIGDTTFYHGDIIGFCSGYCKQEFLKQPEKYASRY